METEATQVYDWGEGVTLPKPRHGNAIPTFKVKRIAQLGAEKTPITSIAERLGIHPSTISRYLRAMGRPARPRVNAEGGSRAERVVLLAAERLQLSEIAERLGILPESVVRYMRLARQMGLRKHLANAPRGSKRRTRRAHHRQA